MVSSYQLTEEAYLTILLHASKYPSCTVCGVLLGELHSGANKAITVTTAVPLFHLSMLLAPCVETALTQVETYAAQQSLRLIGYYHSEAHFDAKDVHPVGKRIAERIAERQPDAFIVLMDNQKLAELSRAGSNDSPFELLVRESSAAGGPKGGSSWKKVAAGSTNGSLAFAKGSGSSSSGSWEELRMAYLNLYSKGVHQQLADFDEHLDDITKDYLNKGLLESAAVMTR